jgi:hypothetical protein
MPPIETTSGKGPQVDAPVISTVKARALLFLTLSLLWVFPVSGAIWIMVTDSKHWNKTNLGSFISSLVIQDWVAIGLVACHLLFLALALRFHRKARAEAAAPLDPLETVANRGDSVPPA